MRPADPFEARIAAMPLPKSEFPPIEGAASVKLAMLGQLAFMISEEESCGRPLFAFGFDEFKRFARKVLEVSDGE